VLAVVQTIRLSSSNIDVVAPTTPRTIGNRASRADNVEKMRNPAI